LAVTAWSRGERALLAIRKLRVRALTDFISIIIVVEIILDKLIINLADESSDSAASDPNSD